MSKPPIRSMISSSLSTLPLASPRFSMCARQEARARLYISLATSVSLRFRFVDLLPSSDMGISSFFGPTRPGTSMASFVFATIPRLVFHHTTNSVACGRKLTTTSCETRVPIYRVEIFRDRRPPLFPFRFFLGRFWTPGVVWSCFDETLAPFFVVGSDVGGHFHVGIIVASHVGWW